MANATFTSHTIREAVLLLQRLSQRWQSSATLSHAFATSPSWYRSWCAPISKGVKSVQKCVRLDVPECMSHSMQCAIWIGEKHKCYSTDVLHDAAAYRRRIPRNFIRSLKFWFRSTLFRNPTTLLDEQLQSWRREHSFCLMFPYASLSWWTLLQQSNP